MSQVKVRYCKACMYLPRAERLGALLRERLRVDVSLEEGAFGEFSVWLGEVVVASRTWRGFPKDDEVLSSLVGRLSAAGR